MKNQTMLTGYRYKLDTRQVTIGEKTYTSFTPHMHGNTGKYQNMDSYCCDMESWLVFQSSHDFRYGKVDYIRNCLAQILFNNQHIESYGELANIYLQWVHTWRGNEVVGSYAAVEKAIADLAPVLTAATDLKDLILSHRIKSHWYPLEVELVTDSRERSKLKARIRSQERASMIKEDIRTEVNNFKNDWWNISPTAKHISICADMSLSTVHKHGKDLCIPKKEFTHNLVQTMKSVYPNATQVKLLEEANNNEGLGLSLSVIKQYWNPK